MIDGLRMEKRAIAFREKYGLSHTDPINYRHLLEELGVITVFKQLSESISGMAIKTGHYKFMMINTNITLGRQNFTIGHELYHLFEQENFKTKICNTETFQRRDREEYLADLFGTYLLLPNDGIMALIPEKELSKDKIELTTILSIEQRYMCSRTAVLFRLQELGLITDDYKEQFKTDIVKGANKHQYPTDLYFKTNVESFIGPDYLKTAESLYDKGDIREVDYISFMSEVGISRI